MPPSLGCDELQCSSQENNLRSGIAAFINVKWKGINYSFCCWECVARYAETKGTPNKLLFY